MEKENKNQEAPKKGWLSKLGSAIFEEDASSENQETKTATATEVSGAPSKFTYSDVAQISGQATNPNPNTPNLSAFPNANGVFDEKFYNSFLKVIEANNIDGIDYFEFARAKKANDSIPGFTEPMKYQTAFNTLKTLSSTPEVTKDHLIKTADFYLEKLNHEETEFVKEMKHEVEVQVDSRLNKAKAKQEEIVKKQEEINKLQIEMGTLQGEIGTLNVEAQQIQIQIDSTAKNFKVSLEVLKGQINTDKQNINNYIQ